MNDKTYKRADFVNNNEVRWCPGCGDYAILAAIQKLLPELNVAPEKHVFISGIGCAGRLPYYMNTFGFHTIHGRALAVATGLKSMRDDLTVWVITGDGDALSIGGNHFIHCLRRNLNVNILLINNQVYGLTKGQFSPTSTQDHITKTSPHGVQGLPVNPVGLALAAGASFVARAVDKDPNHLKTVLKQAYEHQGCSLVEIYQDCHIFHEGAFDGFSIKSNRAENTVVLQDGEPMLFGSDKCKGLALNSDKLEVMPASDACMYRHDASDLMSAIRLGNLVPPEFPVPLGVYYQKKRPIFDLTTEITKNKQDLANLFRSKSIFKQT
ncbi:MAG: 2-oxoacid:ferredoxin oxidoreductase subunit beta [Legionellaceae bacterium]|nr:2-oxoacid:ferredoxin oxidoreductase subunit beta [Legionellaceae bacterium]